MSKKYPPDVLSQAESVRLAWNEIDAELTFGNVNVASLAEQLGQATELQSQIGQIETVLVNRNNQRDELFASIWDKVKRARAGVKANYGDDSSEYEMIGGTRISERKSPTRKVAA